MKTNLSDERILSDTGNKYKTVNFSLTAISIIIWTLSSVGNVRLLQYSRSKWVKKKTITNKIFYTLTVCNVLSCISAIPFHIIKLMLDNYGMGSIEPYICLFRNLSTMVTIEMSLITLTALIVDRRDKILKVPYGVIPQINKNNKNKYTIIVAGYVVITNVLFFIGYLSLLVKKGTSPCEKQLSKHTISKTLTYIETVKICSVALPCIIIICRSISALQRKMKEVKDSRNTRIAIRKINQTYCYSASFMAFWIPFGIMAVLAEEIISAAFYNTWFNIGYTVSYGYIMALPIVNKMTDANFRFSMRQPRQNTMRSLNTSVDFSFRDRSEGRATINRISCS